MSDRSINEQLREEAERQGLIEPDESAIELGGDKSASVPIVRQPVSLFMIATVTALDLLALVILLTISLVAGVVMLAVSGTVMALWLSFRIRSTARGGRRR